MRSVHREYDLGEGSGAIRSLVYELAHIEMVVVPPTSLKKYATGNSAADKAAMVAYAVRDYGLTLGEDDDDAADAAHLAHLAYSLTWPSRPATRHAAEVLRGLRAPARPKPRTKRIDHTHNI